ncbi:sulfurtransferase TusA family protein [Moraxella pluranimalium]|uniref:Preprotein translocase subunit TatC n=1 Tax=Moraxella pluranimalium TaxID=470453 RepID=A0A1T0CLZ7_9GAMM|nr:sulfurtransferase TusA family protein [Moraxella pluranimalium]OOS23367.1 preprotein translocase subunit TatC [Moraxella pluranimalium]
MTSPIFDFLDTPDQTELSAQLTDQLHQATLPLDTVTAFFDARNLPCPMPLLKAKLSLRSVADGKALYLIATDKNSQHDLVAFCQKNGYTVHAWQSEQANTIIYHFIIIKP